MRGSALLLPPGGLTGAPARDDGRLPLLPPSALFVGLSCKGEAQMDCISWTWTVAGRKDQNKKKEKGREREKHNNITQTHIHGKKGENRPTQR